MVLRERDKTKLIDVTIKQVQQPAIMQSRLKISISPETLDRSATKKLMQNEIFHSVSLSVSSIICYLVCHLKNEL